MDQSETETKSKRRHEILEEILKSEQAYVDFLDKLIQVYLEPLRKKVGADSQLVSSEEIKQLFANVEMIYNFNTELSKTLVDRANKRNSFEIGDIFLRMTPFLKMYAEYSRNYEHSVALLAKLCATRKDFRQFIENQRQKHQDSLHLTDYLIMPVQRIPRYKLLLDELLKVTNSDHNDYKNLVDAFKAITDMAEQVNRSIHDFERINIIMEIENKFSNHPDDLVEPHRRFIKEGTFTRIQSSSKREYTLFLFNDILVFGQKDLLQSLTGSSKRLRYKGAYNLLSINVRDIADSPDIGCNFFLIEVPSKVYYFHAKSLAEKTNWIIDLVETKEALARHTQARKENCGENNSTVVKWVSKKPSQFTKSNTLSRSPSFECQNGAKVRDSSRDSSSSSDATSDNIMSSSPRSAPSPPPRHGTVSKNEGEIAAELNLSPRGVPALGFAKRPLPILSSKRLEEIVENNFSQNHIAASEWRPPSNDSKEYYSQLHSTLATRASMAIQKDDLKFYTQRPLPMPPIHQLKHGTPPPSLPERSKPRPSTVPCNRNTPTEPQNYASNLSNNDKASFNLNLAEQILNETINKSSSVPVVFKQPPTSVPNTKVPPPPPKRTYTTDSLSTTATPKRLTSKTKSFGHMQHSKVILLPPSTSNKPKPLPKPPHNDPTPQLPNSHVQSSPPVLPLHSTNSLNVPITDNQHSLRK
jgi:hypothetical protein